MTFLLRRNPTTALAVKARLLSEDKLVISLSTISYVADMMHENGLDFEDAEQLYFNCIVDGLEELFQLDLAITSYFIQVLNTDNEWQNLDCVEDAAERDHILAGLRKYQPYNHFRAVPVN